MKEPIIEGVDYYLNEQGYKVFTEAYHLKRGFCCKNGCKHCAYGYNKQTDKIKKLVKICQSKFRLIINYIKF